MRIHKWLSQMGIASRRKAEVLIAEGRVQVNGAVATVGQSITEKDRIHVDGRLIRAQEIATQILLYHKPEGEIVTRFDSEERRTVFQSLPKPAQGRWVNVGRLDLNTMGLLLFTNDGEFAHQLMHPKFGIKREYAVRVRGELLPEQMAMLKQGVALSDGMARFERIEPRGGEGYNRWYHVELSEGRNRIVRRLIESQDLQVSRLIRVRFGSLTLPAWLKAGRHTLLDGKQLQALFNLTGYQPLLAVKK